MNFQVLLNSRSNFFGSEPSSKLMEGLKNLGGKKFEINAEGSAKSLTLPSLVDFSIFLKEF